MTDDAGPAPAPLEDGAPVSDDAAASDDTDSDVAEAWEQLDVDRQRVARRHALAEVACTMPTEKRRGYIELGRKIIGRIAMQPRLVQSPSVHISCKYHVSCQRLVELANVPDTRLVRLWMADAKDYDDAEAHWDVQTLDYLCKCCCRR